jgi:Phosphodiester glycosidase
VVYGPDDADLPEYRDDPYRRAPFDRAADPSPPVRGRFVLDPFRIGPNPEPEAAQPQPGPSAQPQTDPLRDDSRGRVARPEEAFDQVRHGRDEYSRDNSDREPQSWSDRDPRPGFRFPVDESERVRPIPDRRGAWDGRAVAEADREVQPGVDCDEVETRRGRVGAPRRSPENGNDVHEYDYDDSRVGCEDDAPTARPGSRPDPGSDPVDPKSKPPNRAGESPGRHKAPRGKPKQGRKAGKVRSAASKRRRKIALRSVLGVFLLISGYVGATLYPYLTQPGTDPVEARVAEWGRDHHLGAMVTWLENTTYQAPATGGSLTASQLAQLGHGPAGTPQSAGPTGPAGTGLPADIVPLASPPLPGEGAWQPVTLGADGRPIVAKAVLRPDAQHTSALAYVEWMKQSALKFTLNPGYQQPGGSWPTPDKLVQGQSTGLVATWNGGFKLTPNDDALGGFYAAGRTAIPLVDGQASEVFDRDGSIKIGQWGRDETMGPDVTGVRQNLSLLVDGGRIMVAAGAGSGAKWGVTVSNAFFVARSGVGMTADGDIVYVGGSELSVLTLAQLLKAAGAVYGMELDINKAWVSFMNYSPGSDPSSPTPVKAWDFEQAADRYYLSSDRDFVSVYVR